MGASRLVRIGSPYNGVELAEVDHAQTADVMYLAHIDHPPTVLERYSHTDWRFSTMTIGPAIAAPASLSALATTPNTDADNSGNAYFPQASRYVVTAVDDETGQESRGSPEASATNDLTLKRNFTTLTWPAVTGADRYRVYKAVNTGGLGYIGTTEALTFVDDNIGPGYDQGPPVGSNPFAAEGDYPSTVAMFEQRLLFARTINRPNGIWGSRSAEFRNFDTSSPLRDDDALALGVVAGRVNEVNQLASVSTLLALTSDAVFKIDGANEGGYLTGAQARARRQIGRGSSRLDPLVIDSVVFYRPNTGSTVRAIGYSFEQDGFKADDVSIYSPHLFAGFSIKSWAYAQEPDSVIWAARSDGKLLCFTWEQEQQVWGWTLCETDGEVESVCVVSEDGEDRLYLTVWRQIAGEGRLYIERMASSLWDDPEVACFLDCAAVREFEQPRTTINRLEFLEGRNVTVLGDGAWATGVPVENGSITLPPAIGEVSRVVIGLPYAVTVETLPLALGGEAPGRKQQLGSAVLRFRVAGAVDAGPAAGKLYPIKQRRDEPYGSADWLLTGDYRFDNERHVAGQVSVVIRQNAPLPFELTGAFLEPVVGD